MLAFALELVAEQVQSLGGGAPRLLDVGCGDGGIAAELARAGARVVGVDPSRVALERAGRAHPELELAVTADGGRLPFTDSDFDAAVCLNVLQHVADTQSFLSELRRVLKPRGAIAIAVPWHGRVKGALLSLAGFETLHDPLEPVLRHYTPRSLRDLLGQLGFEQVAIRAAGGAPLWHRTLLARARRGGLGD